MNEVSHTSTVSAEEILAQAISPEKKQELTDRLTKLKATLNQIESRMSEEQEAAQPQKQKEYLEELEKRVSILERISYETRSNISAIAQIQLTEKYHAALQPMIKNLEKVNYAHGLILDSLLK